MSTSSDAMATSSAQPTPSERNFKAERRFAYLMSDELENDIRSGFSDNPARTIVSPLTLPSELGTVLLSSNPWEEREMQRKLKFIKDERKRRLIAIEWNQRAFFISQVFDHDQNLRFSSKKADAHRDKLMKGFDGETADSPDRNRKQKTLPHVYAGPLGMFTPPLEYQKQVAQNEVKKKNAKTKKSKRKRVPNNDTKSRSQSNPAELTKLPPIDQSQRSISVNGVSLTGESSHDDHEPPSTAHEGAQEPSAPEAEEHVDLSIDIVSRLNSDLGPMVLPPVVEEEEPPSTAADHTEVDRAGRRLSMPGESAGSMVIEPMMLRASSITGDHPADDDNGSLPVPPLCRSVSLPNLGHSEFLGGLEEDKKDSMKHGHRCSSLGGAQKGTSRSALPMLCDHHVVTKLTNMLTPRMMLKATENITQLVQHQQQKMIQANRQVTEKRTINDPRFHKLEEILEVEEEKPEFVI